MSDAVIAVDVGGTTIKGAIVDRAGHFSDEIAAPTPAQRGPDAVVAELLTVIGELRHRADGVGAIGVVVPGAVDADAGIARYSANLGFHDVPLREMVAGATGLPAVLDHDVRTAGVAERTVGLTAQVSDYLLAVIGTGIAAVVGSGGRELRGSANMAGELGHIPVWPEGEPCPCGQRGCLERYASAAAVSRHYARLSGREAVSAGEVVALRDSDPAAGEAWRAATEALGIALATSTMLFDPALIVLAGGLSEAGDALLEPVRAELGARVRWRDVPPVALSRLGGRAGRVGAAVLAWQALGERDFSSWRA
ncbi:MAG TPA: ROK family protein [Solirubrobacteraceae bacterium]|nr:ROK family protein [Solirubrobacteraceae bacterium]